MERTGRIVHPAVSSVLYLTDAPDPTIVIDESLDTPLAGTRALLAHPKAGSFLAFDGELLHGVLPGPFAHRAASNGASSKKARKGGVGAGEGAGGEGAVRLTLLVAWYTEHTLSGSGARPQRLGAQSAIPRCTRAQTWPAELELDASASANHAQRAQAPKRVRLPEATPVWEPVPPAVATGAGEPCLVPPQSVRQHFFLKSKTEVGDRLREEHGVGGTWSKGRKQRRRL